MRAIEPFLKETLADQCVSDFPFMHELDYWPDGRQGGESFLWLAAECRSGKGL